MAESMACGTPVIAMAMGAAPEIVVDGETGFICLTLEDCVAAVAKVPSISRQACRDHVAVNFGVGRMVDGYEAVYRQLINERLSAPPPSAPEERSPPAPSKIAPGSSPRSPMGDPAATDVPVKTLTPTLFLEPHDPH
jgi:hypothetical protein